jgi:DNA-binding NtrC family response regulator
MTFHNPECLDLVHLPHHLRSTSVHVLPCESYAGLKEKILDEAGTAYFLKLLSHYRGNVTRVADHAGLNRRHLSRLLQNLRLDPSLFRHT